MAGKIKGITIEIGGETTKLDKALNDSKQKSKDLQKELKGVNSLLKFDPKNTELLNQKQKLLTKSVSETKDRLNTLREAQAQVTEQFEKGEIGEEAYRDFQREIVNTENKLKSLEKELSDFGSVGAQKVAAVGEEMKDIGGKVENAGKKMSIVSGGIVAIGGASVAAAKEVDQGYDIIIEKTGATGNALDDMKQIADNLFSKLPVEMSDVGSAVGEVNTRFGLTGEALESTSEQFLKFAQINKTDVSSSVDLVQKSLEAFSLDSSHAGEMLDILNKVGQDTGISVDKLSSLMVTNASTMRELGFNAQQSATFLGKLEKSGIDSSTVLTGLKTAMKNAAKDGKSLDEGLAELESTMKNSKNSQEAMSASMELFGAKAGPQLASAIQNGVISFEDLTTAAAKSEEAVGSVSNTFEATLDPWDQAKTTMNELKTTGADLASTLLTSLQPIITNISEKVSSFAEWFKNLDDSTKQHIITLAGIVAAIGPVLVVIGKIIGAVGTVLTVVPKVISIVKTVKTAASGLFAVLQANPIVIVIAAIAALVAVFVGLYKHNEKFRNFVDGIWAKIKEVFSGLPNWFKEKFSAIKNVASNVMNALKGTVSEKLSNIKNAFVSNGGGIKGAAAAAWEGVKGYYSAGFTFINKLTGGKLSAIANSFKSKMDSIKNTVKSALDKVKNFFSGLKLNLPKIKLPHFKLSGSFSLKPPSVPSLKVDWYAKAMDEGMILNSPTIFGINRNGQPMGGGEVPGRSETVVGTDSLMNMINNAVTNAVSRINLGVYMDGDNVADHLVGRLDTRFGTLQAQKARGTR